MVKPKQIVENSEYSLIKEVSLDEAGFGEKLKDIGQKLKKSIAGSGYKSSEGATRADAETLSSASHEVLTSIFQIPTGEKRLVVYLSDGDVNNLYRKKDGAKTLVNAFAKDKQKQKNIITAFPSLLFSPPNDIDGKKVVYLLGDSFTMSMLDKSIGKNAVLLNIENSTADYFAGSKKPASLKECMEVLADAIDHKNFMAVVSSSGADILSPSAKESDDIEVLTPEFNFEKIVKAFTPVASLQAAKEEWKAAQQAKAGEQQQAKAGEEKNQEEFEKKVLSIGKTKITKFVRTQIMEVLKGKFPKTSSTRTKFVNSVIDHAKEIIDTIAGKDTGDTYEHLIDELIQHVIDSSNRKEDMEKLFSGETAVEREPRAKKSEMIPDVEPTSTEVKAAKNILKSFKDVTPEGLIKAIHNVSK